MNNDEMITVKCYNEEEQLTRKEAIRKFTEAVLSSEGSENDRYVNILEDLYLGKTYCTDEH